jgi:hypothetical protein
MRKVVYLFFLKNYVKGDRCTLIYAWGVMMIDRHMMKQSFIAVASQAACA